MEGTDAAAVQQALGGDREAFRGLVDRYSRSIFRLAYRMTGNEHDAEEVVQDTFLRAYRRLGKFESRANFGTWLYRIGINCWLDYRRARQRHEEHREPDDPEGNPAVRKQALFWLGQSNDARAAGGGGSSSQPWRTDAMRRRTRGIRLRQQHKNILMTSQLKFAIYSCAGFGNLAIPCDEAIVSAWNGQAAGKRAASVGVLSGLSRPAR